MNKIRKDWAEIKTNDSWAIFKIMSEFVEGYERMAKIGPCISIFGSARTKPENQYYQLGIEVAEKLARAGYGIITGGGPGIMEAANKRWTWYSVRNPISYSPLVRVENPALQKADME